jgi:hypothetical protein
MSDFRNIYQQNKSNQITKEVGESIGHTTRFSSKLFSQRATRGKKKNARKKTCSSKEHYSRRLFFSVSVAGLMTENKPQKNELNAPGRKPIEC